MPQGPSHDKRQESFWHSIVVPTAVGVEAFLWRVAWFGLLLGFIFGGCLQQHIARRAARESQASDQEHRAVSQPPRPGS